MKTYPMRARIRDEGSGPTRIDIFDDIGAGGWFSEGYTPASFADAIKGVTGPLDVHINSGGGDVADGIAIANAIRAYPGPKRTVVDGMAASIASVIAQAGDERIVEPGAMLMIHDPLAACMGNEADFLKVAETLGKHGDNLAQQYADRSGVKSAAEWRDVMRQEAWYTADEAVAAGLADRVGTAEARLPQGVDIDTLAAHAPVRIMAALRSMPRAAAADAPDGGQKCMTCKGKGRLKHPATGANGKQCPECKGAGTYPPPGTQDSAGDAAAAHGHPGQPCQDPDGDGDCDLTPEGDTDHDYWAPDGTQLKPLPGKPMSDALRAMVREMVAELLPGEVRAAAAAMAVRDALPDDVKSQFLADLKNDDPVDIAAGMRRLSQWAASGNYPTGCAYTDLKWFYDQCAAELQKRDPDSDAGGNFPPEKSAASGSLAGPQIFACHALMTALKTLREAAGDGDGAKSGTDTSIFAAGAAERFRAALPALKGARA